jgi:RNA ligase (TIGR02306 family)
MSLATIEKIQSITAFPDPEVERLEIAKVLGYECVVGKGTFKVNDLVVFIYPDSVLPDTKWAEPYKKFSKNRVKTVKIRSFLSFGIVESLENVELRGTADKFVEGLVEGQEVSKLLGITKYESPIPLDLKFKSMQLPHHIPQTDETRWQSVKNLNELLGSIVDVSLKYDGSSTSFYYVRAKESKESEESERSEGSPESFGCTSRSCDLNLDSINNYTRHTTRYDIYCKLKKYCIENNVDLCLRGESYGQGIQNFSHNPHCKKQPNIAFFSVWNIGERKYEGLDSKHYYKNLCKELDLPVVDTLEESATLSMDLINKYDSDLKTIVDPVSGKEVPFEGVVIKGPDFSFKVINKHYDLKKG